MLHQIVLAVCMSNQPAICKDVNIAVEIEQNWENMLPQQCQMIGQQKAAEWIKDHPGWTIQRYSCPPHKKKSQDI